MSPEQGQFSLLLTQHAICNLAEIEIYSASKWGKRVAARYLSEIEAALIRLRERPDLLEAVESLHSDFRFYRVNKHLLVCDVQTQAIFVLAVVHASRDIPSRLAELKPTLATEIELLHDQLQQRQKKNC